ncbi:MAG: hypothetical protein EOO80_09650, partial [Oxalobacteraceae bacterium]
MTIQSKSRGQRMKITGVSTPSISITPQAGAVSASVTVAAPATESSSPLESAVLQPAQSALRALPDFD